MKAIIINKWVDTENNGILFEGGIYENVSEKQAREFNPECYYIPLTVSGRGYQERKADLEEKAKEYQSTCYDFCGFSYGELITIESFFETQGRRYGLIREFRENAII